MSFYSVMTLLASVATFASSIAYVPFPLNFVVGMGAGFLFGEFMKAARGRP